MADKTKLTDAQLAKEIQRISKRKLTPTMRRACERLIAYLNKE